MVATVTVTGDLDITMAPLAERLPAVAAGRPDWLVPDLSGLVGALAGLLTGAIVALAVSRGAQRAPAPAA